MLTPWFSITQHNGSQTERFPSTKNCVHAEKWAELYSVTAYRFVCESVTQVCTVGVN